MDSLSGRHVVVTGGGKGIGKAIAERLAAEGAILSLLAPNLDELEAVAARVGGGAHVCDIAEKESVDAAFAAAARERGPFHSLVANSGIGGANADGPDDRFGEIVHTNLFGTYWCIRAAVRHLAAGPERRDVVVIASIMARIAVGGYTAYCASKAGLLGLVRSFSAELAPDEVQVNAVCPGWVETDMAWQGIDAIVAATGMSREEAVAEAMREVPLGRMGRPEDIAGTVAYLLSPGARGVTGQAIDQNGGAWVG
ncbi:MAG: SDR family oxidoreductase [Thermoleophilia bacterium]|nr:SDR family oxidoreductase [Thermoleophilia bacterium]